MIKSPIEKKQQKITSKKITDNSNSNNQIVDNKQLDQKHSTDNSIQDSAKNLFGLLTKLEDKEHKTILARITKLYEDNQQNKELVEQIR